MKAQRIVDAMTDRLGAWWKDDDEEVAARQQALSAEKSQMQQVANTVRGMEPNSRALLDLVIGRDSLLKEKQAREQLEAELAKHGLTVDEVEDYMCKERGSGDVRIPQMMGGAEVGTGDLIGVKARGGQSFYFSGPQAGWPTFQR